MILNSPKGAARRSGFTLVEVSLGMAIGVVLTLVVLQIFTAGRRGVHQVRTSLEANEATLTTFRKLTKDIRSSRKIILPELAEQDAQMPDFEWTDPEEGVHVLEVEATQLVLDGGELVPRGTIVRWYLDKPKDKQGNPIPRDTVLFDLYRKETPYAPQASANPSGTPAPAPAGSSQDPEKIASGIKELVFFRKSEDPATRSPDAGPRNVQVLLNAARIIRRPGKKPRLGYTAELRTTVHQRGTLK